MENEDDLFQNNNIQNVIISTPHDNHAQNVIKCLIIIKTFLEKPLAINLDELNKITKKLI